MTIRQLVEWAETNRIGLDVEISPLGAPTKYIGLTSDGTVVLDECDETENGDWKIPPQDISKEILMITQFKDGYIWKHDIQSANEMIAEYIQSIGGNDAMTEDILDCIHQSPNFMEWDWTKIKQAIEDYIDR